MKGSKSRMWHFTCKLALVALLLVPAAANSQSLPSAEPAGTVGTIPGTEMTRDEFKARARAQLAAVALSALAYRQLYNIYPESYRQLRKTECWNFELVNIFTGGQVNSIYFEPTPEDMTTQPDLGLPTGVEGSQPATPPQDSGDGAVGPFSGITFESPQFGSQNPPRVVPGSVRNYTAGDIFYYVDGDVLQLIMYAPDGTYYEHFDPVPNNSWLQMLDMAPASPTWADDILAAQVLHFTQNLVTEHYNHVLFMSGQEPLPYRYLTGSNAASRIEMAREMGVLLLNPYTKEALSVASSYARGCIYESPDLPPAPLYMCLSANRAMTLSQLIDYQEQFRNLKPGSGNDGRPGAPPMGGKR